LFLLRRADVCVCAECITKLIMMTHSRFVVQAAKAQPTASQRRSKRDQRRRQRRAAAAAAATGAEITSTYAIDALESSKNKFFNLNSCHNNDWVKLHFSLPLLSLCRARSLVMHNRISPEESRDESTSKRRGKSAPSAGVEISRHIMEKVAPDGGVVSAPEPDPLEPWSTKDIKSINNILDTSDRE
jgi:hypothetical protein